MLKVGVVGCGSIAEYRHIPEYIANKDVEVVALCDIVEQRAEKFVNKYELTNAKVYTDYKELVKDKEIDAVSVCTPNYLHAPVSIAAAKSGKHVLCEKPLATSEEESKDMIEAAKENDVFLMVGHNQRLMPIHQKAKEIIEQGKLGQITSFKTTFGHPGPDDWSADGEDSWFFRKDEAFIGALGDLGVHKADLMRWLLDKEVTEVGAFYDTLVKDGDVDDNAVFILRMEDGVLGNLSASWTYTAEEDNSTVIYGTKGIMKLGSPESAEPVIIKYANGTEEVHRVVGMQSNDDDGQSLSSGVIDYFVDHIKRDKKPAISGEEGYKSLKVILAGLEAANEKTIIKL
ncbi:putative dehydrogenase [Halobacteroides halobius DSM 5150]|uniref:Putative dehydrogenase n=1 Tax=Halobacteroides halobius (strain ATCC 35273 / DSM 5150 / MD-1) TaxID=748449 RepID=L0K6H3_HALHC|nr:Gfo/Idh/MocA family oxidoreductase [Halobacteroides halobius]AGB40135.1 putative dehydrogenase [Halobacteroides halobius DSM 5150]